MLNRQSAAQASKSSQTGAKWNSALELPRLLALLFLAVGRAEYCDPSSKPLSFNGSAVEVQASVQRCLATDAISAVHARDREASKRPNRLLAAKRTAPSADAQERCLATATKRPGA